MSAQPYFRSEFKFKFNFLPASGRNRPTTPHFLRKMAIQTLPRTPRGEGDTKTSKNVPKYSWEWMGGWGRGHGAEHIVLDRPQLLAGRIQSKMGPWMSPNPMNL